VANLRNAPIDRRRLSKEDRELYNTANPGGGRRGMALSRARTRRGALAYSTNRPINTTDATAGAGGLGQGATVVSKRAAETRGNKQRAEGFKPEKFKLPEDPIY